MPQRTFVLFKPDSVERRLVGQILQRFEAKGLKIEALKFLKADRALAERHYAEHKGQPFYPGLIDFITRSPVVACVLSGPSAVMIVRRMVGKTNGMEAEPGTIRGDFGICNQSNLIHGSDSPESAAREIALWFQPVEVVEWERRVPPS